MAKAGLLFVGTDDGLVLFSNPNEIGRWLKIGQPFRGASVRAVWAVPDQPLRVFAAVDGLGVQQSDDGGQQWQALFDWPAQAIAGTAAGEVYIRAAEHIWVSRDQGNVWAQVPLPGPAAALALLGTHIYASVGTEVVFSVDGGVSWARYGSLLPAAAERVAATPQQVGQVYAVAGGALYTCAAADGEWAAVANAPQANGPIAALPGQNRALLIGQATGGIVRSDDAGARWNVVLPEHRVSVIVPASYHVDTVFAGGSDGQLWGSTDRGRGWQAMKSGLPAITSIAAARLL